MKITLDNGKIFEIFWKHHNFTNSNVTQNLTSYTECFLKGDEVNSVGTAYLANGDNFCKATGRKISLTRMMEKVGFTKPVRKLIWQEYFKCVGKKSEFFIVDQKNVQKVKI